MKNNIFKIGAVSLLIAGAMASCSDDYLETRPYGSISKDDVTANVDNAQMAIYGICRGMFNQYQGAVQGYNGEAVIMMLNGEIPSQDYYSYEYAVGFSDLVNMQVFPETENAYYALFFPWAYCYTMINGANQVLAGIDAAEGDAAKRAFVKAQALTFRAHGYSRLLQLYAPRWADSNNGEKECVVLRTEDMQIEDSPLVSMNTVFELIYKDMTEAVRLYEEEAVGVERTFEWEPDYAVACGVFARAALLKDDWKTAATMANKARQNVPLMSNEEYASGFCTPTSEWMWNSSGDVLDQIYYWSFGTTYACNGYMAINYDYGAGCANVNLLREFPEKDIRRQQFMIEGNVANASRWHNENYIVPENLSIKPTAGAVIRQAKEYLASRRPANLPSTAPAAYVAGSEAEATPLMQYGAQTKFWITDLPGVGAVCFMRGSEMLLIEAEAKAELGQTGEAQALLNELNAQRQPGYNCTASGEDLINEVRLYRRLELWGEGFNFFDFKRWNLPIERKGWKAGDEESGNAFATIAREIQTSDGNGWKYNVPRFESQYNDLVEKATSVSTSNEK